MSLPSGKATAGALAVGRAQRQTLIRRGLWLEYATLGWNVVGVAILAFTAIRARSVALAAFGIDSLIEILASTVVVWQLRGTDTPERTRLALRIIAVAFAALGLYVSVQAVVVLAQASHPGRSVLGAVWLGVTAAAMFALARGKAATGRRLDNAVLRTEARITLVDGLLASAVLTGVLVNAAAGVCGPTPPLHSCSSSTRRARRGTRGRRRPRRRTSLRRVTGAHELVAVARCSCRRGSH